MNSLSVVLFFGLVVGTFASDVLVFTDSDFSQEIGKYPIILVEFYAPWCGHCKRLAPDYEAAATALKNADPPVPLAKVDCDKEKATCDKYGVSGFPTLKIFKDGKFSSDFDGARDAKGIEKYMLLRSGPPSKLIKTNDELVKYTQSSIIPVIMGYFASETAEKAKTFMKVASDLADDFNFAHTYSTELSSAHKHEDDVVLLRSKKLQTTFEPSELVYTGDVDMVSIKAWIRNNANGLCGIRTEKNLHYFEKRPLFMVYFKLDYERDPKGANYRRNRLMGAWKKLSLSADSPAYLAVSDIESIPDADKFGIDHTTDTVKVVAFGANDKKFVMDKDFGVDNIKEWMQDVLQGTAKVYVKSEPIPAKNDDPVKVVVADTFDSIVKDPEKDVLIEFYAPWCGHCKKLAPIYDELGKKLKDVRSLTIAKIDATSNDYPSEYAVSGFPTIYFVPKGSKDNPILYDGGRTTDEFIKFLMKKSTDGLEGYDASSKKKSEL